MFRLANKGAEGEGTEVLFGSESSLVLPVGWRVEMGLEGSQR